MSNKNNYEGEIFSYSYPYTWDKRNRIYLKLYEDRPIIRDFILPVVYRLRFYDTDII